jgi:hypothetical protein
MLTVITAVLAVQFASSQQVTLAGGGGSKAKNNDAYIGTATMTKDGTIVLDLRSKARDGTIGEARLVYPKNHKQYSEILKHLGGLAARA